MLTSLINSTRLLKITDNSFKIALKNFLNTITTHFPNELTLVISYTFFLLKYIKVYTCLYIDVR
ncbi:hypothetical protein CUN30_04600 [Enterococcus faecalis]|nr:hypothetical protein [Enterococcus faecalis]EGO8661052.1 hypothetical protein [Enterococcus faecalis]EGO9420171.1 hypothetical protein [Enterococcus faecalis]PQB29327.1 hypothetical protein CUN16_07905 [Enterococcus faecalis]PQB47910.1 hypothetical protein CUN30_04600 [Enterococcus faecalis]